jgi:hypothetical protein
MSLERTYPIVLPQGGTVTPATPGVAGSDGTVILYNTVNLTSDITDPMEATSYGTYIEAGTFEAEDIIYLEALFEADAGTIFNGDFSLQFGTEEVCKITLDNTGANQTTTILAPTPLADLTAPQIMFKLKAKIIAMTAGMQLAEGSFQLMSWSQPEKFFRPIYCYENANLSITAHVLANMTSVTGTLTCKYFTVIQFHKDHTLPSQVFVIK